MRNWQDILIAPSTTIKKAIEIIDSSSLQIALVVDGNSYLLGTVTDGDVRRGILKSIPLEDPVHQIMNSKPTFASKDDNRDNILATMKIKNYHHMPIVDDKGCVVGLETLEELIRISERENWVFLMAGGLGTRLKPLTDDCPKPMLKVGGRPVLETILLNFINQGFKRFFLSVNFKAQIIEQYFGDGSNWGVKIDYIHEKEKMGTAGSLNLLPNPPELPMIVMNADLLTKVNFEHLLNFHSTHNSMVTMCVREYDFQIPFGLVTIQNHKIQSIDEKPSQRFFINAGIYVLNPEILSFLPQKIPLDMTQVFQELINRGKECNAFPIREYWLDIGHMDDYERGRTEYNSTFDSAIPNSLIKKLRK